MSTTCDNTDYKCIACCSADPELIQQLDIYPYRCEYCLLQPMLHNPQQNHIDQGTSYASSSQTEEFGDPIASEVERGMCMARLLAVNAILSPSSDVSDDDDEDYDRGWNSIGNESNDQSDMADQYILVMNVAERNNQLNQSDGITIGLEDSQSAEASHFSTASNEIPTAVPYLEPTPSEADDEIFDSTNI